MSEYRTYMSAALAAGDLEAAAQLAEVDRWQQEITFADLVDMYDSAQVAPDVIVETVEDRAESFCRTIRDIRALGELDCDGTCEGRLRHIDGRNQAQVIHPPTGAVVEILGYASADGKQIIHY